MKYGCFQRINDHIVPLTLRKPFLEEIRGKKDDCRKIQFIVRSQGHIWRERVRFI
jgi:hypothetical protein